MRRLSSLLQREDTRADPLPPQLPDSAPRGSHTVQLLRTDPRRRRGYVFAPDGERSIARSYLKVLQRARSLIYIEDQYLWSPHVARPFAEALAANPELYPIAVIPRFPDHDGRVCRGHRAWSERTGAGGAVSRRWRPCRGVRDRKPRRHPVDVHAKTCVVDDVWASVGSDNFNRRSWTHDSELSCAVMDDTPDLRSVRCAPMPMRAPLG